jgi:hypothetical protein
MGQATIVSVCNFPIGPEFKPGLFPNDYIIPAAEEGGLGIIIISDAFTDIPQLDRKNIRVTVPAAEVARSLVEDWKSAQLMIGPGAQPGLFYVDGALSEDEIIDELSNEINKARDEHTEWAQRLVKMADDLWAIKPLFVQISAGMIYAAKYLHVDRVWTQNVRPEQSMVCPSCNSRISSLTVVCPHCSVILNEEKHAQFNYAK